MKMNSIVDPALIDLLYRASRAGVEVDLIVRGTCSLIPGRPGISERIRVRSIVGEFLEHSRIFTFLNGGQHEWYIGSADIMERNLDRRVEAVVPVEDLEARLRLAEILETMLHDDRRSWQLGSDGRWRRTEDVEGREGTIDTFARLKRLALSAVEDEEPEPPAEETVSSRGSMDPRA
jgi:polyphosphate kinase